MEKQTKKIKKRILIILHIVIAITLFTVFIFMFCRIRVTSVQPDIYYLGSLVEAQGYDYILVPGAGLSGSKPGVHLTDRLDTAILLYNQKAAPKILLSGAYDSIEQVNETVVMRVYLEREGIPTDDIICDEYGVDTAETLRRAKAYDGAKKFLVCTQSLYAERTTYLAEYFHLDISIAESDIRIYTTDITKTNLRETLAATKAVVRL